MKIMLCRINFIIEVKNFVINKRLLSKILKELLGEEGREIDIINLLFCDKKRIEELNFRFLKREGVTDVLSFSYEGIKREKIVEIVVCLEEVEYQAERYNKRLEEELLLIILHSLLHSIGYTHKTGIRITQKRLLERIRYKFRESLKTLISH